MTPAQERYAIPAATVHVVDVIDRSRFLTTLGPADSIDAARNFIERVSAEYSDANHNCYAFLVGPPGSSARIGMSDDGEPHGTAGSPMLNVLLHCGLGDVVAVVTRYFGGIKLGRGGLVRAYSGCLQHALDECRSVQRVTWERLTVSIDYPLLETVKRIYPEFEAKLLGEEFTDRVSLTLKLPLDRVEELKQVLVDRSKGKAEIS